MLTSASDAAQARWRTLFAFAAFAVGLYGMKLWVIGAFANGTPYWDQWDAELDFLFVPLQRGTFRLATLFLPHNEHRILTTRITAIALFELNRIWNPLLEMIVNAAIHTTAVLLLLAGLWRSLGRRHLAALLIFSFIVVVPPFGWENTLLGFQGAFYWLVLFSVAAMWLLVAHSAFSMRWWFGLGCAVLAYFSLASGVFAGAAAAAAMVILYALNVRRGWRQGAGTALLVVLFLVGYKFTPVVPDHAGLMAASTTQFVRAVLHTLSWPLPAGTTAALARNAPALVYLAILLRRRPAANDARWFLLTLAIWIAAQAVTLGYGRGRGVWASRYLDVTILGLIVNFACLLRLLDWPTDTVPMRRVVAVSALAAWTFVFTTALASAAIVGLPNVPGGPLLDQLNLRKNFGIGEETNTRNFLATSDLGHLQNKGYLMIPYPSAERLGQLLANPQARDIMPVNVRAGLKPSSIDCSPDSFKPNGYSPYTPKRIDPLLGSYATGGEDATGQATISFAGLPDAHTIAIPVAGYPTSNGIELSIEQAGQLRTFQPANDPKDSWEFAYVEVRAGPFAIHVRDTSSRTWVALGSPVVAGRVDPLVSKLLTSGSLFGYEGFLSAALALAFVAAVLRDASEGTASV